jgi:hypothetical protein
MSVTYRVEIAGTNLLDKFTSKDQWAKYVGKVWSVLGPTAVRNILNEINQVQWRHATGNLQRAVAWQSGTWSMVVYMDPAVAPYAIYQEVGVHEHVMRYLLTATRPIPLPVGRRPPTYRWATERWMGVPHPFVDDEGNQRMATGWTHPGYEGKFYFRRGIERTLEEASSRLRGLVFRMTQEE